VILLALAVEGELGIEPDREHLAGGRGRFLRRRGAGPSSARHPHSRSQQVQAVSSNQLSALSSQLSVKPEFRMGTES